VIVAHAAETELWEKIAPFVGRPDMTDAQAGNVRDMLEQSGAREFAETLLDEHVARARALLASPKLPDTIREEFEPLISSMVDRNK
jgi:geranylgeranyl diphosphate synthase type II